MNRSAVPPDGTPYLIQEMIRMAVIRFLCLLLCIFLLCESLAAVPGAGAEAVSSGEERIVSLDDLAGRI